LQTDSLSRANVQLEVEQEVFKYLRDPIGYAKFAFPWAEMQESGPRVWQADVLKYIQDWLANPATRYQPCRVAISSGHGIGKSALVAMVMAWALSTCDDCKCVVTANTATQLATKTVPRVEEWFRKSINSYWWDLKATSITIRDPKHIRTWRADYVPWSEYNTEAFAGLHNIGKRILLVFDEASGIADRVWEVAEGALTDENTEIIWLAFGNPTQNTGRFRECFGRLKHRWHTKQIDSRTVEGTNKAEIAKWIEDYGEDSDFVRVRVRGEFPRAGSNQFIGSDVVESCRRYIDPGNSSMPKVLGVDVARFGDDQTVLFMRQGRKAEVLGKYRGLDTAQVTSKVIEAIEKHHIAAVIVDSDGIGAPVYDQLRFQGYGSKCYEFHGGKPAYDSRAYFNRRAEIWGLMRDWLVAGAQIPNDPELEADLTGPQYGFSPQQQVQLEKKDDMKKRGLSSPDLGDALAMTFGVKLAPPKPRSTEPETYRAGVWS
jgi:hypothetical protein